MSTAKRRRGRPVGSGIDDTGRLIEIAARIAADPHLKPTTAIKAMGITDPSSIRRLRDKYKKFANSAQAAMPAKRPASAVKSTPPKRLQAPHQSSNDNQPTTTAMMAEPAGPKKVPKLESHPAESRSGQANKVPQASETPDYPFEAFEKPDQDWVASWCASNLTAMAGAMDAHFTVTRSMLSVPYFAMAVRQQLALNALALSVLPAGYRRRTLH